jgi:hypothetical protein
LGTFSPVAPFGWGRTGSAVGWESPRTGKVHLISGLCKLFPIPTALSAGFRLWRRACLTSTVTAGFGGSARPLAERLWNDWSTGVAHALMRNVAYFSQKWECCGIRGAGFQPAADFNRPADQCVGAAQAGYKPAAG